MNVTNELLVQILVRLETEIEFNDYSFTIDKDFLSMDGLAVHPDDVPWNVHIRVKDIEEPIHVTFEIDAKNSMNSVEFEAFVRAKVSGAIMNAGI